MLTPVDLEIENGVIKPLAASATPDCIARVETSTGARLPSDYVNFLLASNGCKPADDGAFAIGIEETRGGCPYDPDLDVLIEELFCCHDGHRLDLLTYQRAYGLHEWVPPHVISIGWTPAIYHLLLDLHSGVIYGWSVPGDVPSKYGDIDWTYWAETLAKDFGDCWTRMRIVANPW